MSAQSAGMAKDLLKRVPLFFGLTPDEMRAVIEVCKLDRHKKDEVVCRYGGSSGRMYVLLDGELEVLAPDGTRLAIEKPVTTVGEMGFVSYKPRSATVKVHRACRLLRLEQHDFDALSQKLPGVRAKIFRNVVRILADRLADANDLIARFKKGGVTADAAPEAVEALPEDPPAPEVAEPDPDPDAPEPSPDEALICLFYNLTENPLDGPVSDADRESYLHLRRTGYSEADIEYAVKWTLRNIPSAKQFNLVRLSIEEAFEGRWSV